MLLVVVVVVDVDEISVVDVVVGVVVVTTIGAIASCKLKLCSVSLNIIPLANAREAHHPPLSPHKE